MRNRSPGRPAKPAVSRDQILRTALALLERDGLAGVTMRALARELRVDPMALYHYFADRDALLAEAAAVAYSELVVPPGRASTRWDAALFALAERYLAMLARAGELMRYLATNERAAEVPTALFAARVHAALAPLELRGAALTTAHDVFVDFVHGFALGVPRTGLTPRLRKQLRAELAVVCAGIATVRGMNKRPLRSHRW